MAKTWKHTRMKIADLVLDKENPRKITAEAKKKLKASLDRFGLVQPIVVNKTTGRVVGGHQRVTALSEQGEVEVDVVIGEWSEQEERALNVTLNNRDAQGQFTDSLEQYLESVNDDLLAGLGLDELIDEDDSTDVDETPLVELGPSRDEFWISIKGPLPKQMEALELLRKHLGDMPELIVDLGILKR